jgi:SSS family solute:Na+ symporter
VAGLLFFALPILVPTAAPGLQANTYLVKRTDPAPLSRTYTARQIDVDERAAEIRAWDRLQAEGRAAGARPRPLAVGQAYSREYRLPRKSIFWTQGVRRDDEGTLRGRGRLNLELVALDLVGLDLSRNSYALNETFRILIRTLLPFLVMAAVTLATRRDDPVMVSRFYAKMRTKVLPDREADAREVARSLADVHRHDDLLLFRRSGWELYRWSRQDAVGFVLSILTVACVLVLMTLVVSLGA